MARQARRAATLVPGASLRGLVFDACADNRIPNTFGMLRYFGMPNPNRVLVSESVHLNIAGLAAALRIDESEVVSRRYAPHGAGHRSFYGLHVMKARIEDHIRRFSPAAIAAGHLYHPATHELRDLPFSTVGWDMLQDECPCVDEGSKKGVRQGWVKVNGTSRCDTCGGNLAKVAPVMVREHLLGPLEFVAGLVDPDADAQEAAIEMLPSAIRGASRTLLYDIIMNFAHATSGGDAGVDRFHSRTKAIARACEALIKWPDGLHGTVHAEDCPEYRWDWVRRHYSVLDAFSDKPSPAPSQTNAGSGGTSSGPQATYAPVGVGGKARRTFISALAAARLGHVDVMALKQGWDDGKFTQHSWSHGGERVRGFDSAEVVAIAPLLRVVAGRWHAASLLGIPVYGIEQLLARDLLRPGGLSAGVNQHVAHIEAAQELVDQLANRSPRDIVDPVKLADAIRFISGRPKPWGAVLGGMLDGTIGFVVAKNAGGGKAPIVGRLAVSAGIIPDLVDLYEETTSKVDIKRADMWAQQDALECLNGNRSLPAPLEGLDAKGSRPRLFHVQDILQRAAAGITTSDLARRSGLGTVTIVNVLNKHAIQQIAPGLWERKRAEQLVLMKRHPLQLNLKLPAEVQPPAVGPI